MSWALILHQIETMVSRNTLSLTLALPFLVMSAFTVPAWAQTTGRITGVVQDASGGIALDQFRQVLDCGCPSAALFDARQLGVE